MRRAAAATPATRLLRTAGVEFRQRRFEADPGAASHGLGAAAALGEPPQRVLKTLVAELDGELVVAVLAVGLELDLKALASALGGKRASMADPDDAQRATGYVTGGISPLGQRRRLRTVVDAAAAAQRLVLVSAGRRGAEVELAAPDLVRLTDAVVAPVARRR